MTQSIAAVQQTVVDADSNARQDGNIQKGRHTAKMAANHIGRGEKKAADGAAKADIFEIEDKELANIGDVKTDDAFGSTLADIELRQSQPATDGVVAQASAAQSAAVMPPMTSVRFWTKADAALQGRGDEVGSTAVQEPATAPATRDESMPQIALESEDAPELPDFSKLAMAMASPERDTKAAPVDLQKLATETGFQGEVAVKGSETHQAPAVPRRAELDLLAQLTARGSNEARTPGETDVELHSDQGIADKRDDKEALKVAGPVNDQIVEAPQRKDSEGRSSTSKDRGNDQQAAARLSRVDAGLGKEKASEVSSTTDSLVKTIPAAQQISDNLKTALAEAPSGARDVRDPEAALWRPVGGQMVRTLDLALDPANLGAVRVRLDLKENTLNVSISAAKAETAELLSRDRDALGKSMIDAGYDLAGLSVYSAPTDALSAQSNSQTSQNGTGGQSFTGARPGSSGSGEGYQSRSNNPDNFEKASQEPERVPESVVRREERGTGNALYI